jgi:hypothetical protein
MPNPQHADLTGSNMHKAKIPYGTAAPTVADLDGDTYFQVNPGSGIICILWHRESSSWVAKSSIRTTSSAITSSSPPVPDCVGAIYLLLPGSYTIGGSATMYINSNGSTNGWISFAGTMVGLAGS